MCGRGAAHHFRYRSGTAEYLVYYKIALPYPWLQQRATGADFLIGGVLFMCALTVFFTVANRLRQEPAGAAPEGLLQAGEEQPRARVPASPVLLHGAAVLGLAAVFGADAYASRRAEVKVLAAASHEAAMPQHLGRYELLRAWNDTLTNGTTMYRWGEYAVPGDTGLHVALGISPVLDMHDVELCHMARGQDPVFHGQTNMPAQDDAVDLTVATYNNGSIQWLEGSTVCEANGCRQFSQTSSHVTMVYARPHRQVPLAPNSTRPVPILLRVDSNDARSPDANVRPQLMARMRDFLSGFSLAKVVEPYERRSTGS